MKIHIACIFFYIPLLAFSQPNTDLKSDYDWILKLQIDAESENVLLNTWRFKPIKDKFQIDLLKTTETVQIKLLYRNAQISDTNGNLLMYSDACSIADGQYRTLKGGEKITVGLYRSCPGGINWNSSLMLRSPQDTNRILHFESQFGYDPKIGIFNKNLLCNKIDKIKDTLRVVTIDSIVATFNNGDTISSRLAATRHANGRDWWIVSSFTAGKAGYHKLLVKGDSMVSSKQYIGRTDIYGDRTEEGNGQTVFSPDGTKYARYNRQSDIQIMDFDRCSGLLSNYVHIPIIDIVDTVPQFVFCTISPNSRFLYVISYYYIYQFDLNAKDIAASKIKVATWDGTVNSRGYFLNFYSAQLAPDGRIYIQAGGEFMHVIEHPDSLGVACKVIQRKHQTSVDKGFLPYFPNFRLGALKGSPCDTLGITSTNELNRTGQLKIYPNPATDLIKIDMTLDDYSEIGKYQIRVVDILGKVHQTHPLSNFASIKEISVANLANGLYFVQLVDNLGRILAYNKIVVSR